MKATRSTLILMPMIASCMLATAAQTAGKPVLTPAPAPPSIPAPAMVAAGPVDSSTYVVGPDDEIQVTVYQSPEYSCTCVVRPDGKISPPLLGDLQAAGLTPTQLADAITERTKKFIRDPTVGVSVLAVKSKFVYMMGEVEHVGPIAMAPGMSVLQAIATAGGPTPYAKTKKMYILRGNPGHQTQIPFNYDKAKKGDMQGVVLQPGDTVFVP